MMLLDTLTEMVATLSEVFGLLLQSLLPRQRPVWRTPGRTNEIS